MDETTSREKVLKKVRNALISKNENPYSAIDIDSPIHKEMEDTPDITFAQEFTKVNGKFVYCENESELKENLITLIGENGWSNVFCREPGIIKVLEEAGIPFKSDEDDFLSMDAGITYCEFLIARLGSIMISSKQASGRRLNVFPEHHIVIANTSQIVPDIKDALIGMKERYGKNLPSLVSVITGPSRTADIEKTLVMGAHGPKELYLFLIDNE